jgi:hypothetical protein
MRFDARRIAGVMPATLVEMRATRVGDLWWQRCRLWLAERR